MSLTSYQAAPPRVLRKQVCRYANLRATKNDATIKKRALAANNTVRKLARPRRLKNSSVAQW